MNNLVKLILIDTVAKPLIGAVVNRVSSKVAGKRPEPQEPPITINGLQELQQLQQDFKTQKLALRLALGLLNQTVNLARERDRPHTDVEHTYHVRQLELIIGVLALDRGSMHMAEQQLYPK